MFLIIYIGRVSNLHEDFSEGFCKFDTVEPIQYVIQSDRQKYVEQIHQFERMNHKQHTNHLDIYLNP